MPTRPAARCPSCKQLHPGKGKCDACRAATQRASDQARGSAAARGYTGPGHIERFRPGVLAKHPRCVCTEPRHGHEDGRPCGRPSTVADHWPFSRRQLVAARLDPDDPAHGRGLCAPCHGSETARHQPGGWHRA